MISATKHCKLLIIIHPRQQLHVFVCVFEEFLVILTVFQLLNDGQKMMSGDAVVETGR